MHYTPRCKRLLYEGTLSQVKKHINVKDHANPAVCGRMTHAGSQKAHVLFQSSRVVCRIGRHNLVIMMSACVHGASPVQAQVSR